MNRQSSPRLFLVDEYGRPSPDPRGGPGDEIDARLLQQAQDGAWDAWQELVDRHLADVWSWSVEATATEAEGELVNQLVWLRLAQSLPWTHAEPLGRWLYRAVHEEAARRAARAPARGTLRAVQSIRVHAQRDGTA